MRNFSWEILVGKNEKNLHTTLYIFTRLFNRQDGLQNSRLDSRRLPGPVFDSFSRTAAGNRAYQNSDSI